MLLVCCKYCNHDTTSFYTACATLPSCKQHDAEVGTTFAAVLLMFRFHLMDVKEHNKEQGVYFQINLFLT